MWYGKDENIREENGLLERYNKLKDKITYKKNEILQMELKLEVLSNEIKKQL